MGYYIGGDREDEGNYTPSFIKKKVNAPKKPPLTNVENLDVTKGVALPTEFDPDYFKEKQSKFGKSSLEFWEWEKLMKYSKAVYAFYRQAICQFYAKFTPKDLPTKFEETAMGIKQENLKELAEGLNLIENNLTNQFVKAKRSVNAFIKRYPALVRLRECGARAWVMFEAINKKLYVKDAINFKTAYDNFNLDEDLCLLKTYRGCAIMKTLVNNSISRNMLTTKFNRPIELYAEIDAQSILNELLEKVGGFKTDEYDNLLTNKQIENLFKKYPNLMNFYYNFGSINKIASLIVKSAEECYNGTFSFNGFEGTVAGQKVDVYKEGEKFYNLTNQLLRQKLEPLFEIDIKNLNEKLSQALNYAKEAYNKVSNLDF